MERVVNIKINVKKENVGKLFDFIVVYKGPWSRNLFLERKASPKEPRKVGHWL